MRDNDDEFLAAAWDQAGDVRALREEVNRARLAAEVGRSHARRLATLEDAGLLQATARLHLFVRQAGGTLTQRIGGSAVFPAGLVSAALLRQTRPGSVLARRAAAERPDPTPLASRVTDRFLAGSAPADERSDALERCAGFGSTYQRPGAVTTDTVFSVPRSGPIVVDRPTPVEVLRIKSPIDLGGGDGDLVAHTPVAVIDSAPSDDLRASAALVREGLDPMPAVVAGLQVRITGVELGGVLPARVAIGPRFPDPLFPKFLALGAELLLPGVSEIPAERVRLAE